MQSVTRALAVCGRQGQWVLPLGLAVGVVLPLLVPGSSEPFRLLIAPCIWLLLFFAVLRLASSGALDAAASRGLDGASLFRLLIRVLLAQLLLPLLVFLLASGLGMPAIWCIAVTLVAAASPISGSPNLVLLIRGDGVMALRWLIAGTLLLPLTCLPVIYLLFKGQSVSGLALASFKLAALIISATLCALFIVRLARTRKRSFDLQVLDGLSSLVLALMVIGLMSALHAPDTGWRSLLTAIFVASVINIGLQWLGAGTARALAHAPPSVITTGVICGNRNIALYLTALPASFTDPLLLFIACYQIPMYLTPLLGKYLYRRLE